MKPVLRWAGGKHKLAKGLAQFLPEDYGRLVEPMVGSGALFFATCPTRAVLADSNEELINFYDILAHRTDALVKRMMALSASRSQYYEFRAARPRRKIDRAVRFAYLNRLCWNGLYRVNRNGDFNVPIGSRLPRRLWDREHLQTAGLMLRDATLLCDDFEETLKTCKSGDVVFLDPPYPKKLTSGQGFNRYTPLPFTTADHERLAREATQLDKRGVRVIVTIAPSKEFLSLFPKVFRVSRVRSLSLISRNGKGRGKVKEAILTNYG